MKYKKEDIIRHICNIREEIGHQEVKPSIEDIVFDEEDQSMLIIASDRPEKSIIIGKGGWVVGKLKEKLNINSIHVEAYPDILLREYKAKLTLNKLENILYSQELNYKEPLENLKVLLKERIKKIYDFEDNLNKFKDIEKPQENLAVVALSGGVDSSFSLIVTKTLGFNPIAVTVNPGSIILPKYFHKNIEELSNKLNVDHRYIEVNMDDVIKDSLEGRFHPCGRCSKIIKKSVLDYAKELGVKYLIYGDMLSTGSQSIVIEEGIVKINLPAMLSVTKGEIKNITSKYGILSKGGYGCPLINEVHKKYPYMRKFSIQRVLRETRAGVLEPGEALEMIMKSI